MTRIRTTRARTRAVGASSRPQGDLCSAARVAVLLTKASLWPELQMQVSTCTIAQGRMSVPCAVQSTLLLPRAVVFLGLHYMC